MSRSRRPLVAVVIAPVLALVATLGGVVAPAAAATTGQLQVSIVDGWGRPVTGAVYAFSADSVSSYGTSQLGGGALSLDPGRYGLVVLSQWGGMTCVGLTPCDASWLTQPGTRLADATSPVVVTSDATTTYPMTTALPVTVSGTPQIGSPLTATPSPAMQAMKNLFATAGYGGDISVQWNRDGVPIPVAESLTYVPVEADAGHVVGATPSLSGVMSSFFTAGYFGGATTPLEIGAATVARLGSVTTVAIGRTPLTQKQRTAVRVDVSSSGSIPTGTVALRVGTRSYTLTLRNGTARQQLPKLKPGRYAVTASYGGSASYVGSASAPGQLVVKKAKKPHKKKHHGKH